MTEQPIRNGFIDACVAAGMSLDDPVEIAPGEFKPLGGITADKDMDEAIRLMESRRAELQAELSGLAIRLMEKYGVDTLGDIPLDVLRLERADYYREEDEAIQRIRAGTYDDNDLKVLGIRRVDAEMYLRHRQEGNEA